MDLGVQLSIQKFHSKANGSVLRKCTLTALWVPFFMSVGFDGENVIWDEGGPVSTTPLALRAPLTSVQVPCPSGLHPISVSTEKAVT